MYEEVIGLNVDLSAPHYHVLHTPGHYAMLDPVMDAAALSGADAENSPSRACSGGEAANSLQSPSASQPAVIDDGIGT